MQYDTIVIGMGAAGTTAASTLAKAGKKVLALEAQGRIGGRVHTEPFAGGVVELGAEWIHGQFPSRVYDLAVQNNVTVLSQDMSLELYRSDGSRTDIELMTELFTYCLDVMEKMSDKEESLGQLISRKFKDYLREHKPDLLKDEEFVTNFLDFMDLVVNNYEASNSWNDVSALSKYEELGGDQHMSWHRHGYKTFFEILLNTYNNGPGLPTLEIKLNKEVTNIQWPKDGTGSVVVTCRDGDRYSANNVIVTVSLGVLKERYTPLFTPPLPQDKITAIQTISMGLIGKIVLHFDSDWTPSLRKSLLLYWTPDAKNRLSKEDRWMSTVIGTMPSMGSNNTMIVWTHGETTKLKDKVTRYTSLFSPVLPDEKIKAIKTVSIGVMDKIIVSFATEWWNKRATFLGFLWRNEQKKKIRKEDYWMTRIFGASMPMGAGYTLTLWTSGDAGKMIETLPEDVVKRKVVQLLQMFMGANVTVPEPTAMLRSTWYSNPFTRGSYTYDNMQMPRHPHVRAALAAPLQDAAGRPRVLFAGEATHDTHFSTVHGASDTGYREAMRLLPSSKI